MYGLLRLDEVLTAANFSQGLEGQLVLTAPAPIWSGYAAPFSPYFGFGDAKL